MINTKPTKENWATFSNPLTGAAISSFAFALSSTKSQEKSATQTLTF